MLSDDELRAAGDRVKALREENAKLERRLLQNSARRNRILITAASCVLVGTLGYALSLRFSAQAMAEQKASFEATERASTDAARKKLAECQANLTSREKDVRSCREQLQLQQARPPQPCRCDPGDPLCSCL